MEEQKTLKELIDDMESKSFSDGERYGLQKGIDIGAIGVFKLLQLNYKYPECYEQPMLIDGKIKQEEHHQLEDTEVKYTQKCSTCGKTESNLF